MLPIKKDYAAKLKELGAAERYARNLETQIAAHPGVFTDQVVRAINSSATWFNFLAMSFVWGNTPEGYEYWYNLAAAK